MSLVVYCQKNCELCEKLKSMIKIDQIIVDNMEEIKKKHNNNKFPQIFFNYNGKQILIGDYDEMIIIINKNKKIKELIKNNYKEQATNAIANLLENINDKLLENMIYSYDISFIEKKDLMQLLHFLNTIVI